MKSVKNNLNEKFIVIWIPFLRTQDKIRFSEIQRQVSVQVQHQLISVFLLTND